MNQRNVTLRDVAERSGTSVPTASYVLSGSTKRYVNSALRERILAAAEELGYVPLERKQEAGSPTLAVILPQTENVFFSRLVRGLTDAAVDRGYLPFICYTDDLPEREMAILQTLKGTDHRGFVLVPSDRSRVTGEVLKDLNRPFVIAERPLHCEVEFDFFSMDNYHSGYEATMALIRSGHRKIGLITWETGATTLLDRHVGYARALEEAGIPYRTEYVRMGPFSEEAGLRMTRELLEEQPELTAIYYAYHVPAKGGIRFLRDRGIRVPEELSVVISGDPQWVTMSSPAFTHMTLPSRRVGERAVTALMDRIERKGPDAPLRECIPGTLTEGSSIRNAP